MTESLSEPEDQAGRTEREIAGREATARELAQAKRTVVAIFSAGATVAVGEVLKVSIVGMLAVFAGVVALIVLRAGTSRVWARRRDKHLDQPVSNAQERNRRSVGRAVGPARSSQTGLESEWRGLVTVYSGLAAYFLAESDQSSGIEAFGLAMATVVAVWVLVGVALRLTGREPRPSTQGPSRWVLGGRSRT